jgi:hypothetical protein
MKFTNDSPGEVSRETIDWVMNALHTELDNPEELSVLAADVDGIRDASRALTADFNSALSNSPTKAVAENLLIQLRIDVEHLLWHWKSLTNVRSLSSILDLDSDDS